MDSFDSTRLLLSKSYFSSTQAVGSGVAAVGDGVVSGVTAVQEVGFLL